MQILMSGGMSCTANDIAPGMVDTPVKYIFIQLHATRMDHSCWKSYSPITPEIEADTGIQTHN